MLLATMLPAGIAQASEHYSDHEQICRAQPDCQGYLRQQINLQPPESVDWYKLQSYLLDFYFDKQKFSELRALCELLLALPDKPVVLQAQLYFYYAKVLLLFGERQLAMQYAQQASEQLTDLFAGFANPLRLVELANLQLTLGQTDRAELLLLKAEGLYGKSRDPVFLFELYSNKALVEDRRQQLGYARIYRQRALDAILQTEDAGKIIVALGNLARTKQLLGQYQSARQLYQRAMPYLTPGADDSLRAVYLLRLAELCWQLSELPASRQYLLQLNPAHLNGDIHQQLYQQLLTQLAQS